MLLLLLSAAVYFVSLATAPVQQLIAMIEGAEGLSPLVLPTQLVLRESTGPANAIIREELRSTP